MANNPKEPGGYPRGPTPLKCDKCDGIAPLEYAEAMRSGAGIKETLTYKCEQCGAEMIRYVISY
jgi:hypothetical protein